MTRVAFFDLAAELRNRIYRLSLVKDEPITPHSRNDRVEEKASLALLKTCRQIRKEAGNIYLLENIFRFCHSARFARTFSKFLSFIDISDGRRLKSIVLECHITLGFDCVCELCGTEARIDVDIQSTQFRMNEHWTDEYNYPAVQMLRKRLEWDLVEWKGSGLTAVTGFAERCRSYTA